MRAELHGLSLQKTPRSILARDRFLYRLRNLMKEGQEPPRLPEGQVQAEQILYFRSLANWTRRLIRSRSLEGKSVTFFDPAYPPQQQL